MYIDGDVVLFGLCMWATLASWLAVNNHYRAKRTEEMLMITMLGIRRVAQGKAKVSLNADGTLKMESIDG